LKILNSWTIEKRRNREDFVAAFKTYKGFTWLSIDKLFERDANIKGTRGYSKIGNETVLRR